jgi:hypothetical protein
MRINTREAAFVVATAALLFLAMAFLFNAFLFAFTAGDVMANPNAKTGGIAELKRAANLAFDLFVVVQILLAFVAVASGALKSRLNWIIRAGGAILGGLVISYLGVVGIVFVGGLPKPLETVVGVLGAWIQHRVQN